LAAIADSVVVRAVTLRGYNCEPRRTQASTGTSAVVRSSRGIVVLDLIVQAIIAVVSYVPAQFVPQDSVHFVLVRGMLGLLFVVTVILIIALRPVRTIIRYLRVRQSSDYRVDR
jgi:hypothetical protein